MVILFQVMNIQHHNDNIYKEKQKKEREGNLMNNLRTIINYIIHVIFG